MQTKIKTHAIVPLVSRCFYGLLLMALVGCQTGTLQQGAGNGFGFPPLPSAAVTQPAAQALKSDQRIPVKPSFNRESSNNSDNSSRLDSEFDPKPSTTDSAYKIQINSDDHAPVVRGQSPDGPDGGFFPSSPAANLNRTGSNNRGNSRPARVRQASAIGTAATGPGVGQAYAPGSTNNAVQQTAYQYPELPSSRGVIPGNGLPSPNIGDPNQLNPIVQPFERGGNATIPFGGEQNPYFPAFDYADLDVTVAQTSTGRINVGGAFNSDNGIVGQFIIDEKDFDITRFPRNFQDILDGNAFRGGGQAFRLEVVPGQDLQRYLVSFTEPYFLDTDYSFSASGYFFDRRFFDWDETRLGGRFSLGRRLTPDISVSAGLRLESVDIDPEELRITDSPQINANLNTSNLFLANIGLIRDTRDHAVAPTRGSYSSATITQAFGDFDYTRADLEYRRHRLIYERPDRSGRHTIAFGTKFGISSNETPFFENYFGGGFSTIRGFDFRGVGPVEGTVTDGSSDNGARVGGRFQWLNTLEYTFPLTADDMIKGVVFCDFGTIDGDVTLDSFRVAPGFGFRVNLPAAGIGAPLAFDFAFPVASEDFDEERTFSFYLGVLR